jgi:asparagine synthase (glutamine-hydrolysing)
MALGMALCLRHRGPDDQGVWVDSSAGIALAHQRLSIIDLSQAGHQPMISASGRYVLVYNGELYNFRELRNELQGSVKGLSFRGHSDTEVMLACLEAWELEDSLKRWNGMFAFAVWDREARTLHLGRDRFGEKPLYYSWMGSTFVFGSELKALRAHSSFQDEVDRDALAIYLRHSCVPAPHCIYKGVFKLPPATFLTVVGRNPRSAEPVPYWSIRDVVANGLAQPFVGTMEDAAYQLEVLLRDAIKLRMVADVPLGVFLSGGVDSSTVTALMQAQSSCPVRSFSIGLLEVDYNEAHYARSVAEHLNTEHTELYVTPDDAKKVIPRLPLIYDEPFADSSQIPTFLLAELTRQHVTVSLSGDGGDEIFGGYNRHLWSERLERVIARTPLIARQALAALIEGVQPAKWDSLYRISTSFLSNSLNPRLVGQSLHKLAWLLSAKDLETTYQQLISHWLEPSSVVFGSSEPLTIQNDPESWPRLPSFAEQMMFLDSLTYLPDDILTKVDRATMAVGLESRIPFLDHRIVEFVWRLPLAMRIKHGKGKRILRKILNRYVPASLVNRPKSGFAIPLESWLRGPLREWGEELIAEHRLNEEGFFSPPPIRQMWGDFLRGTGVWHMQLWDVLMFQAWLEEYHRKSTQGLSAIAAAASD